MSGLRIVNYPEPVLRAKGAPVREFGAPLRRTAEAMLATMREAKGLGLAAPQVGLSIQFFVVDVSREPEPVELDGKPVADASTLMPMAFANAEVDILPGEPELVEEGCLSFPGVRGDVPRVERCAVRFRDLEGAPRTLVCSGLLARCIQHEHDHCQGVLFIDRMTGPHRLRVESKLKRLVRDLRG